MNSILTNLHSSSVTLTQTFASIPGVNIATPIIALIIAAFLALVGYKLKKVTLALVWFILGLTLASTILPMAFDGVSAVIILAIGIILGCIFAFLGFKIEQAAIFVAVTFLAFGILSKFTLINQEFLNFLIKAIISIIIGGVALSFTKPIFIIVSCLYAACLVFFYLPELVPTMTMMVCMIISAAVFVVGMATQFSTTLKED